MSFDVVSSFRVPSSSWFPTPPSFETIPTDESKKKDAAKGGGGGRRLRFLRVPFLFVFSGCVVARCSGRVDALDKIYWKQRPFQIHHLGSQNIFFLWLKVGFLVKCMASRLQTNNELSSLFQRKKKVFRISARRTTTRPRETCGINVVVVVSRIWSVGAVRTARGDPRELHGARFSFSHFFSFLFRVKNLWGEFWLRFVSRGYFFARCGGGRCG